MKRFSVKYFVQGEVNFDLTTLIPIFHKWIQQHSLPGLLIDVADYRHVHQGPGILLISHEADYVFEQRGGNPSLTYVSKQPQAADLSTRLILAFETLKVACGLLEGEPGLNTLRFNYEAAEIIFLDRLNAPNRPQAFEALRSDLQTAASTLFGSNAVQPDSVEKDPRKCLTVRFQ